MLAACGAGSGSKPSSTPETTATPAPLAAADALLASAMRVAADGRGVLAQLSWNIERNGFHISGDGSYVVNAAGDLKLATHYRGQGSVPSQFREANDSQVSLVGNEAYVLSPPLGSDWVKFAPQEFGADWYVVKRLASARSPIDYSSVARAASPDAHDAGHDSIDGQQYDAYRGAVDANVLMKALADAYGSQGQAMFVNRFSGPIPTEVWLDTTTSLPRRLRAEGHLTYLDGDTHLVITVDFTERSPDLTVSAPGYFREYKDLASGQ